MNRIRATIGAGAAALTLAAAVGLPAASAEPASDAQVDNVDAPVEKADAPGKDLDDREEKADADTEGTPPGVDDYSPSQADPAPSTSATAPRPSSAAPSTSGRAPSSADQDRGDRPAAGGAGGDPVTDDDDDVENQAGALRVATGPIVVTAPARAGELLTAMLDVVVTDTRADSTGWAVDVRAGHVRGSAGSSFALGDRSYYRAGDTDCSRSIGAVPLNGEAAVAAVAGAACARAAWTSELGIAVPADAPIGDYRLTLTHSVY